MDDYIGRQKGHKSIVDRYVHNFVWILCIYISNTTYIYIYNLFYFILLCFLFFLAYDSYNHFIIVYCIIFSNYIMLCCLFFIILSFIVLYFLLVYYIVLYYIFIFYSFYI